MIEENVKALLSRLEKGNCFGEKVTLVAATKTRTVEEINRAINAGITDIGENRVQEFKDKFDGVIGGNRHFIGHLQTNKVKYLIGKTDLYHSVDRDELVEELSKRSKKAGIVSNVLIQVNIGNEESKGGYPLDDAFSVFLRLRETEGLRVRGFMAMLPAQGTEETLSALCKKMRALYERAKEEDPSIDYLSMGMSGDWELCLKNGANMIRLGTAIFGERNYS
ncbi:MAG: YggS family pyridoxal phosphate-dependent enzyme [Clostridia bacterium]|nr:YggS family pyridoxal phosphate-dependent enzyme [Clostridia bacterium]